MSKEIINYTEFNRILKVTALKAGALALKIYHTDFDVEYKEDDSPVTIADKLAEEVILKDIKALTPNIPIVAEESVAAGRIPKVDDIFWLVDPIDGTKSFINKSDEFTVNIALIENGIPTFGIIYAPALNKLYATESPEVATLETISETGEVTAKRLLKVRKTDPNKIIAVASKSHRDELTDAYLKEHNVFDTLSVGSSLKFCLIAEALADLYPRFGPTMEWDIAAGHAILNAAGGKVLLPDGQIYPYAKKDFLNGPFIASS